MIKVDGLLVTKEDQEKDETLDEKGRIGDSSERSEEGRGAYVSDDRELPNEDWNED